MAVPGFSGGEGRRAHVRTDGRPWPALASASPVQPSLALPLLLLEVPPQGKEKLSKGPENRKRKQHNLLTSPLSRSLNWRVVSVQIQTELTGGGRQRSDTGEPRTPPRPHCRPSPDFRPLTTTPSNPNIHTAAFSAVPAQLLRQILI